MDRSISVDLETAQVFVESKEHNAPDSTKVMMPKQALTGLLMDSGLSDKAASEAAAVLSSIEVGPEDIEYLIGEACDEMYKETVSDWESLFREEHAMRAWRVFKFKCLGTRHEHGGHQEGEQSQREGNSMAFEIPAVAVSIRTFTGEDRDEEWFRWRGDFEVLVQDHELDEKQALSLL